MAGLEEGYEGKLRVLLKKVILDHPVRRDHVVFPVFRIFPFDDASHLDIGQGKGLGLVFHSVRFYESAGERLAAERRNGPIRSNRPRANIADADEAGVE